MGGNRLQNPIMNVQREQQDLGSVGHRGGFSPTGDNIPVVFQPQTWASGDTRGSNTMAGINAMTNDSPTLALTNQ